MVHSVKEERDGSVTIYIQKEFTGKAREKQLAAGHRMTTAYLVMRLYWPKLPPNAAILFLRVARAPGRPRHLKPTEQTIGS